MKISLKAIKAIIETRERENGTKSDIYFPLSRLAFAFACFCIRNAVKQNTMDYFQKYAHISK